MAKKKSGSASTKPRTKRKTTVEDYRHDEAKRKNNPPAKIAAEGTVPAIPKAQYAYSPRRNPRLLWDTSGKSDKLTDLLAEARQRTLTEDETRELADALQQSQPWLEWADKREQHQRGFFDVDPVALHIHERISAQAILKVAARQDVQRSLFADPELEYHEAVQFYRHDIDWANRLILGDSLQVMSSLARREDLAGKVQMIYLDPPYGIKFASNFQPEVGRRDVKDKEQDLTREPEMVKAYRDTWHLGIHSYLSYLRDRLTVARELLADTGSIFVQMGEENLHRVRVLLDEVFGHENSIAVVVFRTTSAFSAELLSKSADYLLWYARDRTAVKYRQLFEPRDPSDDPGGRYMRIEEHNGARRFLADSERLARHSLADSGRVYRHDNLTSQDASAAGQFPVHFGDHRFTLERGHWKTNERGMERLSLANRLGAPSAHSLAYVRYQEDFPFKPRPNVWTDTQTGAFTEAKQYVVQTNMKVIERCMLMSTEPGDLVLDPTCGSGTTAHVAERWGRRWITIDTSRVAIAIARQRLLTCRFDRYRVIGEDENGNGNGDFRPGVDPHPGFDNKTVPHVTLKSIAQNTNLDPIFARHEPILDKALADCNFAVVKVTDAVRAKQCAKLASKAAEEGVRATSDADARRWLLPGTSIKTLRSALEDAFAKAKRNLTPKQKKSFEERIPTRGEVGPSSVPEGGIGWEHWQVPFDTDPDWPKALQDAVTAYREAWRAKMDEVNECIAANAQDEELVDQPEVIKGVVRVSGPFTVEAVQPPELSLGDNIDPRTGDQSSADKGANEGLFDGDPESLPEGFEARDLRLVEPRPDMDTQNVEAYLDKMLRYLRGDGVRFPNNKQMNFTRLDRLESAEPGLHAEGRWSLEGQEDDDPDGRATVCVALGPQYGPVTAKVVENLVRSTNRMGYDDLVIAAFSFDGPAQMVIEEAQHPKLRIHAAHIRPDVNPAMNGLLKEQPGSQLFTVFGQPRTRIDGPDADGQYRVVMEGVDIYNPVDNSIASTGAEKVAAWFIDGDYDGRTFCVTQAFFPDRSAWDKLARALKDVVDPEAFTAFSGTESLPFPAGKHKRVAVKVIDPRGNEVMRVHAL